MISQIVTHVRSRLSAGNYKPAGNCLETAFAAGILLAVDPDKKVQLVDGKVCGIHHWWISVDGVVVDPSVEQFDPQPTLDEYLVQHCHTIDLAKIAWLINGNLPVSD